MIPIQREKADVLIIGSGGAGLRAAIELYDSKVDVLVVGKCQKRDANYFEKKNIEIASFGHIGVGSLHIRPFIKKQSIDKISKDIFKIVKKYNGTLIGEHNAGPARSRYIAMESKLLYKYMKKVKEIFDPNNKLNPHVLFDVPEMTKNVKW